MILMYVGKKKDLTLGSGLFLARKSLKNRKIS